MRALPVGVRHHDRLLQLLQAPAVLHQVHGQPVQQFGVRRRLRLLAQVLGGGHNARPEVGLPNAVHHAPRHGRRLAVHHPLGKLQPVHRPFRLCRRVQERRGPGLYCFAGLQEVAAHQQVRLAHLFALGHHQLRRPRRVLTPQRLNLVIGLLPFGHGRAVAGEGQRRDRFGIGRVGRRQTEPAQVVVHVVVGVPPAVPLGQEHFQHRAFGEVHRLGEHEDGLARLIAAARPFVDAPGGLFNAIDGEIDRPGHPALAGLVPEGAGNLRFRRVHVGRRAGDFHFERLGVLGPGGRGLHFEFSQRRGPIDRPARPVHRQIWVVHQLQADGADVPHLRPQRELRLELGGRIAAGHYRAVLHLRILLPAGGDVVDIGRQHLPARLLRLQTRFPGHHPRLPIGCLVLQFLLDLADAREDLGALLLLGRGVDGGVGLVAVVQHREDLVILFLRQRVVLVVVALGALNGDAQHRLAERVHAVEHRLHPELFRVDAALFVDHRVAQEPGGDLLLLGGIGQQIAGQLLDQEPVVAHVLIQGVDHPIAPEPDFAGLVFFVAVGVGIAGGVEPRARPALTVVGGGQQPVHLFFIGLRGLVGQEDVHFGGRRRQAGDVQMQAAEEGHLLRFRRGLQPFGFELRQDETVDSAIRPGRVLHGGQRGLLRRHERPMFLDLRALGADRIGPLGALVDPAFDDGDLLGGQRFATHRHAGLVGGAGHALVERALRAFAGLERARRRGLGV